MTNDDMWLLIRQRTRGFFERVSLPFGAYENEDDFKKAEEYLRFQFHKTSSPLNWMVKFLKGIEEAETEIVLHTRKLVSFRREIDSSMRYISQMVITQKGDVDINMLDAYNISTYPPFLTDKTKKL